MREPRDSERIPTVTIRGPGRGVSGMSGWWLLALGVALSVLPSTPASGQISARPVTLDFPAGAAAERTVTVRNEGDTPKEFRFYPGDFDRSRKGGFQFLEPGEHPRSCADRLRIQPDGVSVQPGETAEIQVWMEPGERTCWSMVFAEVGGATRRGISVNQRIGIKVFGLGDGAERDGTVRSVAVAGTPQSPVVRVEFENTGETPLRVTGTLEIRSLQGGAVRETDVEPFSVLPGRRLQVEVPVPPQLDPGSYLAIPILDYGAEALAGGQARFRLPLASSDSAAAAPSREGADR
jgi:hypothetical protein